MKAHMRRFYSVLLSVSLAFTACEKPDTQEEQQTAPVVEVPMGTYEYDGKEYPVHSITCAGDDSRLFVRISPFKEDQKQTTYAVVGINVALEGAEIDVAKAWHNDDYYFIYEDSIMYYSQYRHLQSGTIMMKRDASGSIRVIVDIVLPDGKNFKFNF